MFTSRHVLLSVAALGALGLAACGREPVSGAVLTVSAQAEAQTAPDLATITTGVQSRGATAKAAQAAQAARMAAIVETVGKAGVKPEDVQTNQLNLQPIQTWSEKTGPRITGYESVNTITIKVRDLAKVPDILDAIVADGGNRIDGVAFSIEDPAKAEAAAYANAVAKARARADAYAAGAGMKVHRVLSITEGGAPAPVYGDAVFALEAAAPALAQRGAAPPPIAPGRMTTDGTITAVFELRPS